MHEQEQIHFYPLSNHILLWQEVLLTGCGGTYDLHAGIRQGKGNEWF